MKHFLSAVALCCSINATAQTIDVAAQDPLGPAMARSVTVKGLPGNARITITAERMLGGAARPVHYRATATFMASAAGTVDLGTTAPVDGSYQGADASGLFWSMAPVAADAASDVPAEGLVRLIVALDKRVIVTRELDVADPQIEVTPVADFSGAVLARPVGSGRLPVVIVLGGSEGGAKTARALAVRLATQGFAALGLPYFSPGAPGLSARELPDLPASYVDIPIERLDGARRWVATRSDLDAKRIALYGYSKGAEFALVAASKLGWPAAVVAIAPSDVVWQGWEGWGAGHGVDAAPRSSFSWHGKSLPFVPHRDFMQELDGFRTGADVRYRRPMEKGRAAFPQAAVAARIRVEDFKGPLFVAGASDDQMWASGMMAQNIAERRLAAGRATVSLIFADAGHMLNGSGWEPTPQYNAGPFKLGGTAAGNAHAQAEVWRQAVAFLHGALGPYL